QDTAGTDVYTLSLHDALPIYGMDQGALDHLELDSTTADHDLLVARFTVRSVVGDDIVEALATQTFSMDSFGPDGPASVLPDARVDRKSTRLNSSHVKISYAVF